VPESQATGRLGPASLDAMLAGLIDYAGLFPPAGLDMRTAVANYAKYLAGPYARALGRFVLPVSGFAEFEQALRNVRPIEPWGISALVGANYEAEMAAIDQFNERNAQAAHADVIEVKATTPDEISRIRAFVRGSITPYFEIRPYDCTEMLQTISHIRGRAKIRTGGVTADAFPPADVVAGFLMECAKHNVPFKATAGLHHPYRCQKPLTYEPGAPTGQMHGFLNVFVLAAYIWASDKSFHIKEDFFLHGDRPMGKPFEFRVGTMRTLNSCGEKTEELREGFTKVESRAGNEIYRTNLLKRISPFTFQDCGLQEPFPMPTSVIAAARQNFAISFGSCSFEEPIADLQALNLL